MRRLPICSTAISPHIPNPTPNQSREPAIARLSDGAGTSESLKSAAKVGRHIYPQGLRRNDKRIPIFAPDGVNNSLKPLNMRRNAAFYRRQCSRLRFPADPRAGSINEFQCLFW